MAEESCLDLAVVVMTDSTIICYDTTALRCAIFDKVESTSTVIVRTNLYILLQVNTVLPVILLRQTC